MSSHESFPLHPLDYLIAEALQAEVRGVEPSPRVWERIRRRANAWATRRHLRAWRWSPEMDRMSETELNALFLPVVREGLATWRYSLVVLRFMDYAGLMFRFGW